MQEFIKYTFDKLLFFSFSSKIAISYKVKKRGLTDLLAQTLPDKRRDNSHIPFDILLCLAVAAKLKCRTSLTDVPFAVTEAELLAELGWNIWDNERDVNDGLFSESVMRKLLAKYKSEEWGSFYNSYVQEHLVKELDIQPCVHILDCTTGRTARQIINTYELRPEIEEDFRQMKDFWKLEDFKSTKYNYITYHIVMTLVGYLYFQIYKNLDEGKKYAGKSLPVVVKNYKETRPKTVIIYVGQYFGIFPFLEFLQLYAECTLEVRRLLDPILVHRIINNCHFHLSILPIAQDKKPQRSPLRLCFLSCTLESISCVNIAVI